ncbi:MAG TPA: hypothetical protein VIG85_03145 [Comamonas sp.]
MNPTSASTAKATSLQRDVLCVQAVRVLRITAQQWGMRVESPCRKAGAAGRKPVAVLPCTSLQEILAQAWGSAA